MRGSVATCNPVASRTYNATTRRSGSPKLTLHELPPRRMNPYCPLSRACAARSAVALAAAARRAGWPPTTRGSRPARRRSGGAVAQWVHALAGSAQTGAPVTAPSWPPRTPVAAAGLIWEGPRLGPTGEPGQPGAAATRSHRNGRSGPGDTRAWDGTTRPIGRHIVPDRDRSRAPWGRGGEGAVSYPSDLGRVHVSYQVGRPIRRTLHP